LKYLVTGLGNIGDKYANTRHNIGFEILDAFAEASNFSFQDKRYGFIGDTKYKGRSIYCLKPSTYVNLSGNAINYWLKKLKIPLENLFVLVDDIALPFGKIRIRAQGGDGGHNGLIHIIQVLGTQEFARLRFGIGNEFYSGQQVNYVLGEWTEEEKNALLKKIKIVIEIIQSFTFIGLERTMNQYNNK